MMREALILVILLACATQDARTRTVPNAFPLAIAACSLIPPVSVYPGGVLAALPLFAAAVIGGGVGGGDVKVMAALGLVFGPNKAFLVLTLALIGLITWDALMRLLRRKKGAYPFVPFLFAATLILFCVAR